MRVLANRGGMTAVDFDGERFDFGSKLGFLKANVTEAVNHPEVGEEFEEVPHRFREETLIKTREIGKKT